MYYIHAYTLSKQWWKFCQQPNNTTCKMNATASGDWKPLCTTLAVWQDSPDVYHQFTLVPKQCLVEYALKKVGDLTKTSHSNDMYLHFHTKIVRWWACSSHQETWSRRWYDPSTYFNLSSILLLSSLYFICSNQTRMHGGHCCAREWNDCLRVSIACVCLLLCGHRFSTTWSIKHTVPFTNEGFCHENTNFPRASCLNPV